jgi:2,4-dienoyl-CoA reductase (NADPH2)
MKSEVKIPLVATNRINMPQVAEEIISGGAADLVSMARPFLADPEIVLKSIENRTDEINTCIACNQACLDHVFQQKKISCLVNPRAGHETELNYLPTKHPKKIAVIGAGPAGLSASTIAASRGHQVDLFDSESEIGGQFNMAKKIPGKEEFYETLRYFKKQIELNGVSLHLNQRVDAAMLIGQYDEVILATGVYPRKIQLEGIDHPKVLSYIDVLKHQKEVGEHVAIIGAGGIGFDVAEYLSHQGTSSSVQVEKYMEEWGVDMTLRNRSGLSDSKTLAASARKIHLLQRKNSKLGADLGKTTGFGHRKSLDMKKVNKLNGVEYLKIDDEGLHIKRSGEVMVLEVDHVVICAGQISNDGLKDSLLEAGMKVHIIGGADLAAELDAKRAIDQGARLASKL